MYINREIDKLLFVVKLEAFYRDVCLDENLLASGPEVGSRSVRKVESERKRA